MSARLRQVVAGARAWLALLTVTSLITAQAAGSPTSAGASASERPSPSARPPLPETRPLGETLTGQAKSDYEAALVLYKSGDFAGAGRHFSSAYDATRDVRLLWNAAVCEQGMRHYSKAIALVRRYLSSRSALITEEAERNARAFLDAALPLTARLVVEANQTGSSVYLDDDLLGSLPLDPETRIDFGTHRLVVRKPRFVEAAQTLTVVSSADVRIAVQLEAVVHQGRLVVRARKGDAIALDGHFRALSSFDGVLPSGKHRVRVTAKGAQPFETSVLIEDDRTRALDVTLAATPVAFGIPTWAWLAGGAVLLGGAGTATYFIARSPDSERGALPGGSAGKVQLPLR
jgi:hypothetical protein